MESSSTYLPPSLTLLHLWPVADQKEAIERFGPGRFVDDTEEIALVVESDWPDIFVNHDTRKPYLSHHDGERFFLESDAPRFALVKGGEGSGKSVVGIIKTLNRLKRGMSGIMVSPDFEHFKRSLWKEFKRWCPWGAVIPEQRYRARAGWEPTKPFTMTFTNGAELLCGGIDEPGSWEGPNVHFTYFDEARRHKTADALKVLVGRARLSGPNGQPPQVYLTTTPRKHWLFDYFGPAVDDDQHAAFKQDALVVTLKVSDNATNLDAGYEAGRRAVLTEQEARVVMDAEWEDVEDVGRFLSSIDLWDACKQPLPDLDAYTPVILILDAGESDDNFGTLAISRHPLNESLLAARYARAYVPEKRKPLDFDLIESDIRDFCARHAVQQIAYDPFLLGQMIRRLKTQRPDGTPPLPVECVPFPQGAARLEADKGLHDIITQRRIAHDGNEALRKHIDNANAKRDGEGRKLRIVKRMQSLKIDLAVCLSMGCARAFDVLFADNSLAGLFWAGEGAEGWNA